MTMIGSFTVSSGIKLMLCQTKGLRVEEYYKDLRPQQAILLEQNLKIDFLTASGLDAISDER